VDRTLYAQFRSTSYKCWVDRTETTHSNDSKQVLVSFADSWTHFAKSELSSESLGVPWHTSYPSSTTNAIYTFSTTLPAIGAKSVRTALYTRTGHQTIPIENDKGD